jgi:hypothetical protein
LTQPSSSAAGETVITNVSSNDIRILWYSVGLLFRYRGNSIITDSLKWRGIVNAISWYYSSMWWHSVILLWWWYSDLGNLFDVGIFHYDTWCHYFWSDISIIRWCRCSWYVDFSCSDETVFDAYCSVRHGCLWSSMWKPAAS